MDKRIFYIVAIFSSLMYLASCDTGGSSGPQNNPVMYGLVNSTNWRSPDPHAILTEHSIKVYGTSANGQTIIININSGEVGEYNLSVTNGNSAEFIPNMSAGASRYSTDNSESGSGFVRISSINEETKTISGDFSFKAFRLPDLTYKSISDGTFTSVPYQFYNTADTNDFSALFLYTESDILRNATTIEAFRNDTVIEIFGDIDHSVSWQSVTLHIPPTISAGVHYIELDGDIQAEYQTGFYNWAAVNGSMTISEHDETENILRGSFFFNYLDGEDQTQSISGGQFEVQYEDLTEEEL